MKREEINKRLLDIYEAYLLHDEVYFVRHLSNLISDLNGGSFPIEFIKKPHEIVLSCFDLELEEND